MAYFGFLAQLSGQSADARHPGAGTVHHGFWRLVPPDGASLGVEAASLNGKIILCIHNKAPNPGLAETLRKTFESEGVAVLEAEDLD